MNSIIIASNRDELIKGIDQEKTNRVADIALDSVHQVMSGSRASFVSDKSTMTNDRSYYQIFSTIGNSDLIFRVIIDVTDVVVDDREQLAECIKATMAIGRALPNRDRTGIMTTTAAQQKAEEQESFGNYHI